jgi:two-component system response regulator AtoC
MANLLIVDDDENIRHFLERRFQQRGYEVHTAETGEEGLEVFRTRSVDVVILDLNLPGISGMEVLSDLRNQGDPLVIVITASGEVKTAVSAMRNGAHNYICKPFNFDELNLAVEEAVRVLRMRSQIEALSYERNQYKFEELVGQSPQMQDVYTTIDKVAATSSTVLITGESGTGKELVARAIHQRSPRKASPFIPINCTAIRETLLESELFGHERGAFTDAKETKKGLFEIANGGTVLLDEIGDMELHLQSELLRFLEEREFRRVGGVRNIKVDVRILASTHQNLSEKIRQNAFRRDLFYRINVVSIDLPPLRERGRDTLILTDHFITRFNKEFGKRITGLTPEVEEAFLAYSWPGNIRELRNLVERAILLSNSDRITMADLPAEATGAKAASPPTASVVTFPRPFPEAKQEIVDAFERQYVGAVLKRNHGNVSRSAQEAGIDRSSFQRLMRKHGVRSDDFR